jgi:hypothetical protein
MKTNVRTSGFLAVIKISAAFLAILCLQPTDIKAENVTGRTAAPDTAGAKAAHQAGRDQVAGNTVAIIKLFRNSTDSVSIDELTVENGEDRIAVYGALNITRDKEGLRRAQELKALLDEAVKLLSSEKLPDHIAIKPAEKIDNPFR